MSYCTFTCITLQNAAITEIVLSAPKCLTSWKRRSYLHDKRTIATTSLHEKQTTETTMTKDETVPRFEIKFCISRLNDQ